jgi:O-antigen/teichoic acid export membrane protein
MKGELSTLAIVLFSYFCLQFILKTVTIILIADQKPANASAIDLIGQSISLLIIFLLTKFANGSLIYLGLAMGIAPIIVLTTSSLWLYHHKYDKYAPKFSCVNFSEGKSIFNLGVRFFIVKIAALVIYQTNNIVIAHLFGPNEVTVYNIAFKYFSILSMIFMIILTPFWSAFTDAYVRNDCNWMETTLKKLEKIWLVIAFGGVLMLIIAKYLYWLWIGNKVIVPFSVSTFLLLYFLVYTRFSLYIYLLNGIGKIKLQLVINVILALLNIPVIIYLGIKFGLTGVIIGNIIISLPHIIYSPIQLKRIIKNQAVGIWNK